MAIQELEKQLEKIKFFNGYTPSAKELALEKIRENYAEGVSSDLQEHFEKYPGLALCFFDIDGELDGADDLEFVVNQMGEHSFGMFVPKNVRVDDEETLRLEFDIEAANYSVEFEDLSWMPNEVLECIFKAMKKHCNKNYYNSIFYPNAGQSAFFTLCSDRAMEALIKNKIVPAEYSDVPDGF